MKGSYVKGQKVRVKTDLLAFPYDPKFIVYPSHVHHEGKVLTVLANDQSTPFLKDFDDKTEDNEAMFYLDEWLEPYEKEKENWNENP